MPFIYCPVCAKVQTINNSEYIRQCIGCKQRVHLQLSLNEYDYYLNKSNEIYGDSTHWHNILVDEEVSKNPQFRKMLVGNTMSASEYNDYIDKIVDESYKQIRQQSHSVPKCPTCQSENIKKISVAKRATHGALFGIFSKTAFSQFECNNCGYKW